ncbi:MAG: glycosyltransferase [Elusimicrobia bacterium]|nr:glycosyltransferase [Elusimicrobiota bacterium]
MKILLANFSECPQNMHVERAFVRFFNKKEKHRLDIVHTFTHSYEYLNPPKNLCGRRIYAGGINDFAPIIKDHDAVVFIDIAWDTANFAVFLRLFAAARNVKKILLTNHFFGGRAETFVHKKLKSSQILSQFDKVAVFDFETPQEYFKLGVKPEAVYLRGYHVDADYYRPSGSQEDYILAAGAAARDFGKLFLAAEGLPVKLKVFTTADVAQPKNRNVEIIPYNGNTLAKFKSMIDGSLFVISPVMDSHPNQTAGLAISLLAMAMKKPALCRSTPWIDKYIKDGVTGYTYKSLEPPKLRRDILRILKDRPGWKKLGDNARKFVLKKASLDGFTAEFLGKLLTAVR